MTTIILGHPWHGSFNKALYDGVVSQLEARNKPYQLIDLYKDEFDPALQESDLALYSKGLSNDPLVTKYQNMLQQSDTVIFIFPLWWFGPPAIIKGFIDKVMLKDFAYTETSLRLIGKLTHIKQTILITTAQSPKWYIKLFGGDSIGKSFIAQLRGVGMKKVKWFHSGYISKGKSSTREAYMLSVHRYIAKL